MNINDDLKKIFLAGVGAVASTAEKAKELIDEFVKKGELTVEQGKVLNEELKRNAKENDPDIDNILEKIDSMSKEEIEAIKDKISKIDNEDATEI